MINNADTSWILVSAAFGLMMTPGLAFFYMGMGSAKNALNTLKMSFSCLAIVPMTWFVLGYSLAFSPGTPFIGGFANFSLDGVGMTARDDSSIPALAFMVFQMMFAIITPAIISGALVGRMKFKPYVCFVVLWSLFVYSPIVHMMWAPGGYLAELGAIDFAGGTVVHISAGFAAIVAAYILGPRTTLRSSESADHNIPFVLLGAVLLWLGWLGFNAGSSQAADGVATLAFVTTILAAAASMSTWTLLSWIHGKQSSAKGSAISIIIGLVVISPAAGFVTPAHAVFMGIIGCICSYIVLSFNLIPQRIDDTLDVFACYGVAGIVGTLLTGVFASKSINSTGADGLLFGSSELLINQLIAIAVTITVTVIGTSLILLLIKMIVPIQYIDIADTGIDIIEHGESAYKEK